MQNEEMNNFIGSILFRSLAPFIGSNEPWANQNRGKLNFGLH